MLIRGSTACRNGWRKFSNLWCLDYWKYVLVSQKIESRHFNPSPRQVFFPKSTPSNKGSGVETMSAMGTFPVIIFSIFHQLREFFKKGSILGLRQFLITENLLKMIKNAFYFVFLFLFLEIFTFCPDFLVMQKNGLMGKLWLISKFWRHEMDNK